MKKELYRFFVLLTVVSASLCLFASCKDKDDDEDSTEYLDGSVNFDVDSYVTPGQKITLIPRGGTHPDGGNIGYFWSLGWKSDKDTTRYQSDPASVTGAIDVVFPDETGTYTVSLFAYAEDYYSISKAAEVTVVDEKLNASLTNTGIRPTNAKFVDPRDSREYYTKQYGDLVWMRNNLAYSGSGYPYDKAVAMSYISGIYYKWDEAKTACPEGWRLPTESDWLALGKEIAPSQTLSSESNWIGVAGSLMADAYFHGTKMWEYWPEVKITNASGFCAIPAGYAIDGESTEFKDAGGYATFWSADDVDSDTAIYRYINVKSADVYVGHADKESFRASVRCVRDAE